MISSTMTPTAKRKAPTSNPATVACDVVFWVDSDGWLVFAPSLQISELHAAGGREDLL